jgi:transcriptional regulator with XRE-family HTH domain
MLTLVDILQRLGQRIKELRAERGFSQEFLAELSRVHRTYLGHLERGEKNVSIKSLVRVSDALEVTVSELLRDVGDIAKGAEAKARSDAERQIDRERLLREVVRLERTVATVRQIVAPDAGPVGKKRGAKS